MSMVKNAKFNLSKIMKIAHFIQKKYLYTLSEALKCAWKAAKIRYKMHQGPVVIKFKKLSGEIREALGTLHNIENLLVGSSKFESDLDSLRFYSINDNGFRTAKIQNIISYESL